MELPDDHPQTIGLLLRWLYTSRLEFSLQCSLGRTSDKVHEDCCEQMLALAKTYTLADKLCLEDLKNAAMDSVRVWNKKHSYRASTLAALYQTLPADSLMRKFVSRKMAYLLRKRGGIYPSNDPADTLEDEIKRNSEMALELISALSEDKGKNPNPIDQLACDYQEHNFTPKCPDKKDK
jgi:hypothetical protein